MGNTALKQCSGSDIAPVAHAAFDCRSRQFRTLFSLFKR
jgi:hypothetical protein